MDVYACRDACFSCALRRSRCILGSVGWRGIGTRLITPTWWGPLSTYRWKARVNVLVPWCAIGVVYEPVSHGHSSPSLISNSPFSMFYPVFLEWCASCLSSAKIVLLEPFFYASALCPESSSILLRQCVHLVGVTWYHFSLRRS
jgi:hypothetical protein